MIFVLKRVVTQSLSLELNVTPPTLMVVWTGELSDALLYRIRDHRDNLMRLP